MSKEVDWDLLTVDQKRKRRNVLNGERAALNDKLESHGTIWEQEPLTMQDLQDAYDRMMKQGYTVAAPTLIPLIDTSNWMEGL